jgi:hypothetical protein
VFGSQRFDLRSVPLTPRQPSWSTAVRLSNLGTGAAYKTAAGYAFPYGDYFEMDTAPSGVNYVIWSEGTNYVGPGGSWFTRGQ